MASAKIKFREKVGYGLGDFASSMFWKIFSMFLMIFYTDVFGLSAASVGTMFLVTRLWDGINDPLMGIISDRTNTSKGKFRPFLLWLAIPFALVGVLTFTTPDLGPSGKLIYAYLTYTLMMMVYTAVNVPYSSLMGVMTENPAERTSLASFRFIGAFSGGVFLTSTIPYLLDFFRNLNFSDAKSYQFSVAVYGLAAAFLFVITFLWTKERIKPQRSRNRVKHDLKDLLKNHQWFILLGAGISVLIFNSLRDGSIMYYFKYFVKDQPVPLIGTVAWDKLAGAYMTVWLISNLLGVLFAKPLSVRWGKKNTFMLAMGLCALFSALLYALQPDHLLWIFLLDVLVGIPAGLVLPLIWSMYADIADFSEYKSGRRATGLIFSSSSMSQKMGWTLGGAITGWILAAYGFEANVEQTELSVRGIRLLISFYPAAGALLSIGFLLAYKLSDKYMQHITGELAKRREFS